MIPIGFYWNGSQIVVCTAATAPKVKALSSRPNVAMTIDLGPVVLDCAAAPQLSYEPVASVARDEAAWTCDGDDREGWHA